MKGTELALRLNERFRGRDWVADLAEKAGETRDTVEWHLQEDMTPPGPIARAAAALLASSQTTRLPDGDIAADELPAAGGPEFTRKPHG